MSFPIEVNNGNIQLSLFFPAHRRLAMLCEKKILQIFVSGFRTIKKVSFSSIVPFIMLTGI